MLKVTFRLATATGIVFAVMAPLKPQAAVTSVPTKAVISPTTSVEQVYHRHYYHHYGYYHRRYYRPHYYGHYGYYPYYNPAGAVTGAAVGLATAPFWALFGGPYYW